MSRAAARTQGARRRRAALLLVLAVGCSREAAPAAPAEVAPAEPAAAAASSPPPATPRAYVVLEPPRIEIGDVFGVELAVVTPPGYRVAPVPAPKAIAGLTLVDAARPVLEQQAGRWIHRQRFRARARATGSLVWPSLEVSIEAPDGARQSLVSPARPFEVVSLLAEHPERRSPFGFRSPREAPAGGPQGWLAALLGSLATLAALGLVALVRRVGAGREAPAGGTAAFDRDDEAAVRVAAALRALDAERDPVRAADLASQTLRRWAVERFDAPALAWATTEEIVARPAPFLLHTRHASLVAVLRELDALRFPPPGAEARDAQARALAKASAFVLEARGRVR